MKKTLLSIVLVLFVAAGLFAANRFAPRPTSEFVGSPQRHDSPRQQIAHVASNTTASHQTSIAQPPIAKVASNFGDPAVRVTHNRFAQGSAQRQYQVPAKSFNASGPIPSTATSPAVAQKHAQPPSQIESLIAKYDNLSNKASHANRLNPNAPQRSAQSGFASQNSQSPPRPSSWGSAPTRTNSSSNGLAPFTNTTIRKAKSPVPSGLPNNATSVKNLVRANYRLPLEAAKTLENFFGLDAKQTIETVINGDESLPMVNIQITTDAETQRAVAVFLNAVYSPERLEKIKVDAAKRQDVSTSTQYEPTTDRTTNEVLDGLLNLVDQVKQIEKTEPAKPPTVIPPVEAKGTFALPPTATPVDESNN